MSKSADFEESMTIVKSRTTPMTYIEANNLLVDMPDDFSLLDLIREVEIFYGIGARE
jgi:hypothetical protein